MNSGCIKKNSYIISNLSQKHYNKKIKENKDKTMINKFIMSNQEFMNNYIKKTFKNSK